MAGEEALDEEAEEFAEGFAWGAILRVRVVLVFVVGGGTFVELSVRELDSNLSEFSGLS